MLCIRNCLNQRREVLCKTAHKGPEKPSLSVASVPDGALFTIAQLSYDCRPILKVCAMPDYSSYMRTHFIYGGFMMIQSSEARELCADSHNHSPRDSHDHSPTPGLTVWQFLNGFHF